MPKALLAALAVIAVPTAIVCGFAFTGSTAAARLQALDTRRVSDLTALAFGIDGVYHDTRALPARPPSANGRYRLCATFATRDGVADTPWLSHRSGPKCFERNARTDPQR